MLPQILGCYQSQKREKMGKGTTGRAFTQRIEWLAFRLPDTRILLFPLDEAQLPLPLPKTVAAEAFLEHYLPEPMIYRKRLAEAAVVLARRLRQSGDALDPAALSGPEQALNTVLLATLGALGHADPSAEQLCAIIEQASTMATQGQDAQKVTINAFGIHLRKNKQFDTAIAYYRKALELSPEDEHLLFNLARALFEKGDGTGCQSVLEQALAQAPDFVEAQKFLRYLKRHDSPPRAEEDFPDITL